MNRGLKNIAIILASGVGSRFGSNRPKQFVRLAGKPVIEYTMESFEKNDCIDEIIIVTLDNYIDFIYDLVNKRMFKKISKVLVGGKERYDSTYVALTSIPEEEANLIIHDAVRPFVGERIINDCIEKLSNYNAVDVVVDAIDTIVQVDNDLIVDIPDRQYLKRGQTPQAFKKSVLLQAYQKFMQDENKQATDDCGIVLRYIPEEKIKIVYGAESNFKITHQQDIYFADNLIKDGFMDDKFNGESTGKTSLQDKTICVFGASSGIGLDICAIAREAGAQVGGYSRSLTRTDVRNIADVSSALHDCHARYGRIDYIINTTGLLSIKPFVSLGDEEIGEIIGVNYLGVLNVARAGFEYLKASRGMLVNFTSSSFTRGRENYSLYSSTKAAVVNFTQALSQEWIAHDIKVNVINPERTATPMRFRNFGQEPPETLLRSSEVAAYTLKILNKAYTGQVYTIKKEV